LAADLARQPQKLSFSNRLRKGAGLDPVKASLVREIFPAAAQMSPEALAAAIKALPIPLVRPRPIERAISTAGGIEFSALDDNGMLTARAGIFPAGEMLDWEAPTGGYLLTACFASGRAAAQGALAYLKGARRTPDGHGLNRSSRVRWCGGRYRSRPATPPWWPP